MRILNYNAIICANSVKAKRNIRYNVNFLVYKAASLPTIGVMAIEALVITAAAWYYQRKKMNLVLFLAIIYEIGVGLWNFLLQAGLGILFRSENFVDPKTPEHFADIWLVRLVMLGVAVFLAKQPKESSALLRLTSAAAMLGLFGAVTLSEQTILPINDDQIGKWIIL